MNQTHARPRQNGAVLFVGLIMLILITMLAISAIRLANTNLLVVGNEQFQKEAEDAANYHLDLALNAPNFVDINLDMSAELPAFSGTAASANTSYQVTIAPPTCKRYRYIKKGELVNPVDNSVPVDNLACFGGSSATGITIVSAAALNDNSLCATSLWEMTADTELPGTGAKAQITQGIEMRIDYARAKDDCE